MPLDNDLARRLAAVKPHDKEPRTRSVLDSWIAKAESEIDPARSGRLAWLVSTTIAAAKLQSVLDADGSNRFALKGGTLLQHKLGLQARATRDLDGIVRGDVDDFLTAFDSRLDEDWGPMSFARSEIEMIDVPSKRVKPRRFDLSLLLRGQTWRKVAIEISPEEGHACRSFESIPAPAVDAFGLPVPEHLACLSMSYQIAQKIHAATDPHDPPLFVNRRARDVVDLVLLKELAEAEGMPSLKDIASAVQDIFDARAAEARSLGRPARTLPAQITSYPHWVSDYQEAARGCGLELPMEDAISIVNAWISEVISCLE